MPDRVADHVARDLLGRIPSAQLATIPGAGHMCNAELPEAFNRHVREFVQSLA